MNQFLSAVAVAALSGASWIAYKHPGPFRSIGIPLLALALVLLGGGFTWEMGRLAAFSALIPFLDPKKSSAALTLLSRQHDAMGIYLIGALVLAIYLGFLLALPSLLKEERPIENEHDKK